jgi:hypothetical protein
MSSGIDSLCRITVLLEREIVLRSLPYYSIWLMEAVMSLQWHEASYFWLLSKTSKEARSAFVEVVTAVRLTAYRFLVVFFKKNCNGLFTRDSHFVVKCVHKFLALKLLFARTSRHTTHWGHSSPFTS